MSYITILLQRKVDKYVFTPMCYFLSLFKRKTRIDRNKIKKILVIKFWAAGDSIVLLPALQALKKSFPDARIHVLAHIRNKFVFEGQNFIDKIIEFRAINILKLFRKYDLCIDAEPALSVSAVISFIASKYRLGFGHRTRSRIYNETVLFNKKQHMVQNYLDFARKLGIKYDTDRLIPLIIPEKDKKIVDEFLKKNNLSKNDFIIGICPGVAESVKYRMWPLNNFAELADKLVENHKAKIIFIDVKQNAKIVEKTMNLMREQSVDATDLFGKRYTELIKQCKIFIANDSGFMHTAAAEGVKTIGLFGPNTPVLWGPYGKHNISLFKPKRGCPFMDNTNPDLIPNHLTKEQVTCMDAIKIEDVMKVVERMK